MCEPCPEETDLPTDEQEQWLQLVEEEKRLIEALPYVKGEVAFQMSEVKANLNKVVATVCCCWEPCRTGLKQIKDSCDETGKKPTHLEAQRALRQKLVQEHGGPDHTHNERAVAHSLRIDAQTAPQVRTGFDRMRLAMVAQQRANSQLMEDSKAERRAAEVYEAANAQLKASKARAAALAPPSASHKKQKTINSSSATAHGNTSSAVEVDMVAGEAEVEAEVEAADPDRWESYSVQIFRTLFRKYASTSTKVVDNLNTDKTLPARGDDDGKRGWRHHKLRGLYGAVRHWAAGSPFRVAFMLAELAKHFKVEQAVGELLGFALSAEQVYTTTTHTAPHYLA